MAAVLALVGSVALGRVGTLCVPLTEDGTNVCVSLRVVHVAHAPVLPACTTDLEHANALDHTGREVVCQPPHWVRADGGEL